MARVMVARRDATPYAVVKNDTLASIFAAKVEAHGVTYAEFVAYNFGATDNAAVNRAIVERLGALVIDVDASKTTLDPARKPAGAAGAVLVPKLWSADALAARQDHVVKVRRCVGVPGVAIATLDPWFLPKKESCRIAVTVDGAADRAGKASVSVYASRYSTATVGADGDVTYPQAPDLAAEVIWSKAFDGTVTPAQAIPTIDDWKGESTAAKGVLKKRDDARYVNVASSPYTVVARYYADDADKSARLELGPFWPRFDDQSKALQDSLTVTWKVHDSARTFAHGQVIITDKTGAVAHREALDAQGVAAGTFTWADGVNTADPAKMPYRAQVQVHTGDDEDLGVALAAMHTEVRLWVHPTMKATPAKGDAQCLDFAVAAHLPAETTPTRGDATWYGDRLAALGYHPGPVNGDATTDDFTRALREFQRSAPQRAKVDGDFVRLEVTGAIGDLTTGALDATIDPAPPPRPRFGEVTDVNTAAPGDLDDRAAGARLNERAHATGLIVWVDDQHPYTTDTVPEGASPHVTLKNYRGRMDQADDGKVDRDAASMCRPWVPVSARLRVLSRADGLDRADIPAWDDAMAHCVGPLRVDWTFAEAPADLLPLERVQAAVQSLNDKRSRTLAFVKKTFEALTLQSVSGAFANCPVKHGGIRPDAKAGLSAYYKSFFGYDDKSLAPWKAVDGGTSAITSVVHDDLGQDSARWFPSAAGRTGAHVRPSIIAGDGYRVRASLRRKKLGDDRDHPNLDVLAARYVAMPAAISCVLRVWRRTSIRGHVEWSLSQNPASWVNAAAAAAQSYRACHVHMTAVTGHDDDLRAETLLKHQGRWTHLKIVGDACTRQGYKDPNTMAPKDGFLWPWSNDPHLGVREVPDPSITGDDYREKFLSAVVVDQTYDKFYEPLLTHTLDRFEKRTGRLRGHMLVSFKSSETYRLQLYFCSEEEHKNLIPERTAVSDAALGQNCRVTGCHGVLAVGYANKYHCNRCLTDSMLREAVQNSHPNCNSPCTGTKSPRMNTRQGNDIRYVCDRCAGYDVLDVRSHVPGYTCGESCPPNTALTWVSSTKIVAARDQTVSMSAFGSALGAAFVFEENDPYNWAHEMGHHRHMEHAAGAPGAVVAQHDSQRNADCNSEAKAKAEEKNWDRECIMSYGDQRRVFCGKCVLKNRGWRVENLDNPLIETDQGP